MKHRTRHYIEYGLLRAIAGLLNVLPYPVALAVAAGAARIAYWCLRSRVREACRRIRFVLGPELGDPATRRIAWRSWRNFVFSLVDVVRVPRVRKDWLLRRFDSDETLAVLRSLNEDDRGVVLALPHMGSWEWAALACHFRDLPLFSIAAVQKNRLADAYLNRLRSWHGTVVVPRGAGTMQQVVKRLRRGQILAILPDVRHRQPGVAVSFLGGEANLSTGLSVFAKLGRAVILPTVVTRVGWTRHRVRHGSPIRPDPNADRDTDMERMLREVMAFCEEAIRKCPEQWFWFNKRWILDPL